MRIQKQSTKQEATLGIIGKIKIGKKNDRGNPTSLDYFRFTDPFGGRYAKRAMEQFGEQPKQLQVTFASNDFNENCSQRYELRNNKGQLVAFTDLKTMYVSQRKGFEAVSTTRIEKGGGIEACMKAMEAKYTQGKYKAKFLECLYLRVILMGFPVIGQWEIYTKASKSSIKQIVDTYDLVLKNAGRVAWMPFSLTVQKVKSNREIPGESYKRSYSVINLYPDVSVEMQEQLLQYGDRIKGLVTADKIKALGASKEDVNETKQLASSNPSKEPEYADYEEV